MKSSLLSFLIVVALFLDYNVVLRIVLCPSSECEVTHLNPQDDFDFETPTTVIAWWWYK